MKKYFENFRKKYLLKNFYKKNILKIKKEYFENFRKDILRNFHRLLRHPDPPPHHVHRSQLQQRGHRGQAVPEDPGLRGRVELVIAELQAVEPARERVIGEYWTQ